MEEQTKERVRSDLTIAFSALKNEIVIRWYSVRWLRFAGAVMVGLYGSLFLGFLTIAVLATWVWPDRGASDMWLLGVGCLVVAGIGWWIHTADG